MSKHADTAGLNSEADLAWGPRALRLRNERNREHQSGLAAARAKWIRRNKYYYESLKRLLRHLVEPGKRVLNIRCQTGFLLGALQASYGVGVEISPEMVEVARAAHPRFKYYEAFPEDFVPSEKFDYILLCDVGDITDVQKTLLRLQPACERHTRLIIYSFNDLWEPLIRLAQWLHLKIPQTEQNWLSEQDLVGLLTLSGFEWLRTYRTALMPKYIPLFSAFMNRIVAKLPIIGRLCMVEVLIARPLPKPVDISNVTVSVVVPCKDERGNIESIVTRMPELARSTEIIFCDDKSTDGTGDEIRRLQRLYAERNIRAVDGPGICKSKNVWKGFEAATGDILVILDADLTVMPEELPYFIAAITRGGAEFVNGSRLVYPIPREGDEGRQRRWEQGIQRHFLVLARAENQGHALRHESALAIRLGENSPHGRHLGHYGPLGRLRTPLRRRQVECAHSDQPIHYQERIPGSQNNQSVQEWPYYAAMCVHGFRKLKMDYSAMLGTEFRLEQIRAGRPRPGLRPQHLTAVRALAGIAPGLRWPVRSCTAGS